MNTVYWVGAIRKWTYTLIYSQVLGRYIKEQSSMQIQNELCVFAHTTVLVYCYFTLDLFSLNQQVINNKLRYKLLQAQMRDQWVKLGPTGTMKNKNMYTRDQYCSIYIFFKATILFMFRCLDSVLKELLFFYRKPLSMAVTSNLFPKLLHQWCSCLLSHETPVLLGKPTLN